MKNKTYNVKIQLVSDKTTGLKALLMVDDNGSGKRLTSRKDTGSWNVLQTFECNFNDDDLRIYSE